MALAIFRKKIKAKKNKKNGIHLHANTRQLSSDIYCNKKILRLQDFVNILHENRVHN